MKESAETYKQYDDTEVSNNIKRIRKRLRMTKAEVARRIGTTRSNLTRWESGTLPSVNYIVQLASLFSVSIEQLVLGNKPGDYKVLYVDFNSDGSCNLEEKYSNVSEIKLKVAEHNVSIIFGKQTPQ